MTAKQKALSVNHFKQTKRNILPRIPLGIVHYCSHGISLHAHQIRQVEFHQVLQTLM